MVGKTLLEQQNNNWKITLQKLKEINWDKNNSDDWDGRCVIGGTMRNSSVGAKLTAIRLKQILGLSLTDKEISDEQKFIESKNGN